MRKKQGVSKVMLSIGQCYKGNAGFGQAVIDITNSILMLEQHKSSVMFSSTIDQLK
jgi:hypothetical protein